VRLNQARGVKRGGSIGREKGKGKREKAKGKRQKAKGKRQKAKGKRQKAKGRKGDGERGGRRRKLTANSLKKALP
jgi:hypothetical protein